MDFNVALALFLACQADHQSFLDFDLWLNSDKFTSSRDQILALIKSK